MIMKARTPTLLGLALLVGTATAQIGTELCACQPSVVTFTLDFGTECSESTVFALPGNGIQEVTCSVSTREEQNTTDPFPISVSQVQVLELDQNLLPFGQSVFEGSFVDGDSFTYTSIVSTDPENVTEESLPRGFQVTITGLNSLEESIVNLWAIVYTNDCGIFPLLEVGQQVGWSVFTDLGGPPQEFCPIASTAPAPTEPVVSEEPSAVPTFVVPPTDAPMVVMPSEPPSTIVPATPEPAPVETPVEAPVEMPVAAPVEPPPVDMPTCPPEGKRTLPPGGECEEHEPGKPVSKNGSGSGGAKGGGAKTPKKKSKTGEAKKKDAKKSDSKHGSGVSKNGGDASKQSKTGGSKSDSKQGGGVSKNGGDASKQSKTGGSKGPKVPKKKTKSKSGSTKEKDDKLKKPKEGGGKGTSKSPEEEEGTPYPSDEGTVGTMAPTSDDDDEEGYEPPKNGGGGKGGGKQSKMGGSKGPKVPKKKAKSKSGSTKGKGDKLKKPKGGGGGGGKGTSKLPEEGEATPYPSDEGTVGTMAPTSDDDDEEGYEPPKNGGKGGGGKGGSKMPGDEEEPGKRNLSGWLRR